VDVLELTITGNYKSSRNCKVYNSLWHELSLICVFINYPVTADIPLTMGSQTIPVRQPQQFSANSCKISTFCDTWEGPLFAAELLSEVRSWFCDRQSVGLSAVWQEHGSVIYSYNSLSLSGPSPTELMSTSYCSRLRLCRLSWDALPDERSGLKFPGVAGPRQRRLSLNSSGFIIIFEYFKFWDSPIIERQVPVLIYPRKG
jgi:hypothetical protein